MAIATNYQAYDDEGNEIFLYHSTAITPAANLTDARTIATAWCTARGVDTDSLILPIPLSPTGSTPITHYACFDETYENVIDDMVAWIAAESETWTADQLYTISDSATEIKSLFCIVRSDNESETLTHLGLQKVI